MDGMEEAIHYCGNGVNVHMIECMSTVHFG